MARLLVICWGLTGFMLAVVAPILALSGEWFLGAEVEAMAIGFTFMTVREAVGSSASE